MGSVSARYILGVVFAASSIGCASTVPVERNYSGNVVVGRPIEPEAYAAYLRGALAELDGPSDIDEGGAARSPSISSDAARAFREVLRLDPRSVEAWTQLGELACASNPPDRRGGRLPAPFELSQRAAMVALSNAVDLDPSYGAAQAAWVRCSPWLGRSATGSPKPWIRDRRTEVVARSLSTEQLAEGWSAVAMWAEARRDIALVGYAEARLVKLSALTRHRAVDAAERLAGEGEMGVARTLSGIIVDAEGGPLPSVDSGRVGRLAVEDAIIRRDTERARLRATRSRMGLEEAAGRALLVGRPDVARELALERLGAEPESLGARLVLACLEGGDLLGFAETLGGGPPSTGLVYEPRQSVSAAGFVAFGAVLARSIPLRHARAVLEQIAHSDPASGDDLVVREATELVARGVLSPRFLPPDGFVELAARFGISPPASWDGASLDSRHRYLALAMTRPGANETEVLGARLGGSGARDPVVAAGAAWVALGTGSANEAASARALLRRNAADPLLAMVALRLAVKAGDAEAVALARAATLR